MLIKPHASQTPINQLFTKKFYALLLLTLTGILLTLYGQAQNCELIGTVLNQTNNQPIEFANVLLKNNKDSTIFYGEITNSQGVFKITGNKPGNYHLTISFMGYQTVIIESILLQPGLQNMGSIPLQEITKNLEAFSISATKAAITYETDRKVINAGSFPDANSAMDLLENIPSVNVGVEGELTYRGGGEFIVLINGKRVKNGEEKLKLLSAEKIDKIEIITNPPAQYEAEGAAGIIQVVLKKTRLEGYAVNASIKGSSLYAWETQIAIDKKSKKYGWYIEAQSSRNIWNKAHIDEYQQIKNPNNQEVESTYTRSQIYNFYYHFVEMGFNYVLSPKDNIDVSFGINPIISGANNTGEGNIIEKTTTDQGTSEKQYIFHNLYQDKNLYWNNEIKYDRAFNKDKTHLLSFSSQAWRMILPYEEKRFDTKIYPTYSETVGLKGKEENEMYLEGKLDYTLPVTKNASVSTGTKFSISHIPRINTISGYFNDKGEITPFSNEKLDQQVDFIQDIWAGYFTFKNKWKKLSYQLGSRIEHTIRQSDYYYTNKDGTKQYIPARNKFTQWFPSIHITYSKSETYQLTASYSKRIERPHYWDLVPLNQYATPYAYYRGNGNLLPTISHALETGIKQSWSDNFISAEVFARQSIRVKQEYSVADTGHLMINTIENVGNSTSIGGELMTGVNIFQWWNTNVSLSIYSFQLNISTQDDRYTASQIYADSKWNNSFKLPKNFYLKWLLSYTSPTFNAQETINANWVSNISLSKDFLDGLWSVSLGGHNVFNTDHKKIVRTGKNLAYSYHAKYIPYAFLKVAYALNKQK